jgi:hypothetical protein
MTFCHGKFSSINVPKTMLMQLALEQYQFDRNSSCLDKGDVQKLETALAHCDDNRSFAAYGPLATPIGPREATDAMIEWFGHTVAHFAPARHIESPLIAPEFVMFDSRTVGPAIEQYIRDGSPASGYQIPSFNDFNRVDSFARLHEKLGIGGVVGGPSLESIPSWSCLAFVINAESHWSVVIYIRPVRSTSYLKSSYLVHYDSLPGMHIQYATVLAQLLRAAGLIDPSMVLARESHEVSQLGAWQCGYAVMARLYEHSGGAELRRGSTMYRADDVIGEKNGAMRRFLQFALLRNAEALTLTVLGFRWKRIFLHKDD